ncbi:hypothetical protein DSO57_1007157 [Entomophthora muscae]|uniref:Uncharacterized protein n=1 Tax=Entomophthora muscae TaxID=34485 RepID=A0ACC2U5D7_9FUNG|nr:hypothetical protein DSO57_1007157 [Entomophthora muscae]
MLEEAFKPCGKESEHAKGQNITCTAALPHIKDGMSIYNLTTRTQVAFYLFLLADGSDNLSYNKNIWPGEPGYGTRAMVYPRDLHAFLKDSSEILKDHPDLKEYAERKYDDGDTNSKNKALEILMDDKYSFLPGAWWIRQGAEKTYPACKNFTTSLTNKLTMEKFDEIYKQCMSTNSNVKRRDIFKKTYNAIKCSPS